jgi:autotransporter-associated beta strand protein
LQYTGNSATSSNRLFTIGTSGATLDASGTSGGALSFTGSGDIAFSSSASLASLTLTGTGTGAAAGTLASVLADSGTGANITSLIKAGTGTWIVSGNNTYKGQTTISAGTLKLSAASANNIASSKAITVGFGAAFDVTDLIDGAIVLSANGSSGHSGGQILGGLGTVTGSVTVAGGAILSAGTSTLLGTGASNTVGTLTTSATQTWGSDGELSATIAAATGTAGVNWDQIKMAALAVTATGADATHEFYLAPVAALTGLTNGHTYAWVVGNISDGGATGSGGSALPVNTNLLGSSVSAPFALDTSNFTASLSNGAAASNNANAFSLELITGSGITGENLQLQYTATPEPAATLLLAAGMIPMALGRRRRNRRPDLRRSIILAPVFV